MILWTCQSNESLESLLKTGTYRTNRSIAEREGVLKGDTWVQYCYQWMTKQMKNRLPPSGLSDDALPVWAYYKAHEDRTKPDLRRWNFRQSETFFRIEFEIEDELALLSDLGLWHFVFYNSYFGSSEIDEEAFQFELQSKGFDELDKPVAHPLYQNKIEKSWETIFELDPKCNFTRIVGNEKIIQATFWELRLDQVTNVTEARPKRSALW